MGRLGSCVVLRSGPDRLPENLGRLPMRLLLQTLHLVFEAQL
jgi:hypothetical protein